MSDIIWGDPIEVNGVRPEWLEDGVPMRWSIGGEPYKDTTSTQCHNWGGKSFLGNGGDVLIRLPADHPHYAKPDDWQPCERTVRACIEVLPNMGTGKHLHSLRALEALLPKPDPAEALVKEYKDTRHGFPVIHNHDVWSEIERYTRHLINTERLRS